MNERWLSLQHIHDQINSISYTLMAIVDETRLAGSSAYWQAFGITAPSVSIPASTTVAGNQLLLPGFSMVPNAQAQDKWDGMLDSVETIRANMQTQVDELTSTLGTANTYFTEYTDGNLLDDDFYR